MHNAIPSFCYFMFLFCPELYFKFFDIFELKIIIISYITMYNGVPHCVYTFHILFVLNYILIFNILNLKTVIMLPIHL